MGRRRLLLALALSLAYAAGILGSLSSPPPLPAEPPATLRGGLESAYGRSYARLSGTAPVPDGTALTIRFSRLRERHRNGRLMESPLEESVGHATVWAGGFDCHHHLAAPGLYRITLEATPRRWEFQVALWDDEFLPRAFEDYSRVERFLESLSRVLTDLQRASSNKKTWDQDRYGVLVAAERIPVDDLLNLGTLYPATAAHLRPAVLRLQVAPSDFFWTREGAFGGAYDRAKEEWVRSPDGRPFSFSGMQAYLAETQELARRELSLWTVHEARRTGRSDAVLLDGRPGETLDRLEVRLRGEARPPGMPKDPPKPSMFLELAERDRKLETARRILEEADRRWDEFADRQSPVLYRRLLEEFPETLEELRATARVNNRARP